MATKTVAVQGYLQKTTAKSWIVGGTLLREEIQRTVTVRGVLKTTLPVTVDVSGLIVIRSTANVSVAAVLVRAPMIQVVVRGVLGAQITARTRTVQVRGLIQGTLVTKTVDVMATLIYPITTRTAVCYVAGELWQPLNQQVYVQVAGKLVYPPGGRPVRMRSFSARRKTR
jgi:hypothetical protein